MKTTVCDGCTQIRVTLREYFGDSTYDPSILYHSKMGQIRRSIAGFFNRAETDMDDMEFSHSCLRDRVDEIERHLKIGHFKEKK